MHHGEDHCPRDDIYSLMLVFFDLICGKLPWTEASRAKDKKMITALKDEYLTQPQRMIDWVSQMVKAAESVYEVLGKFTMNT